jgi:hypothetical protein
MSTLSIIICTSDETPVQMIILSVDMPGILLWGLITCTDDYTKCRHAWHLVVGSDETPQQDVRHVYT